MKLLRLLLDDAATRGNSRLMIRIVALEAGVTEPQIKMRGIDMKLLKFEMAEVINGRRWEEAAAIAAREFSIALPARLIITDNVLHGLMAPACIRITVNGMCYMLSLPSCNSYITSTVNPNNNAIITCW